VDNLVLIRVADALDRRLRHAGLRDVLEELGYRFRLIFDSSEGTATLLISLRPEDPWIGRPASRMPRRGRAGSPFAALLSRCLRGCLVSAVKKAQVDRLVTISFADRQALVAELATHGANLILLDKNGMVVASARKPRSARERIAPGSPYLPPELPGSLLNPFEADPEQTDRFIDRLVEKGEEPFEAIRRRLFGIGSQAARLVLAEASRSGRSVGTILHDRLEMLQRGESDPVIVEGERMQLFPWPPAGASFASRGDPAATAGLYHEHAERLALRGERKKALLVILAREARRLYRAEQSAGKDLELFEDPEKYRRWGEALLAGLGRAKRIGELAMVPDPYDADGAEMAVPVPPGMSLQKAAENHFQRFRRAERGAERARQRIETLAARRARFEALERLDEVEALERAMRNEGLPVALEPSTKAGRAAALTPRPRLEGVRLFTSSDGIRIMAGRGGKENHRLTFKLAAPDDFWFHALGRAGAHVVARNEERSARPPRATLEEAAAVAAWFSQARRDEYVEVQWTRRKYVRKPRGAKPGAVILKKFETVRVRPGLPGSDSPL
jgi:predicted ribosome quality control (RQC) complex YloA/Tae2 family protein